MRIYTRSGRDLHVKKRLRTPVFCLKRRAACGRVFPPHAPEKRAAFTHGRADLAKCQVLIAKCFL